MFENTLLDVTKLAEIASYIGSNVAYIIPSIDIGINGFLFDIIGEEGLTMDSDITDYWVEKGTPSEDNIALRPIMFKLKGYISEVKIVPDAKNSILPKVTDRLLNINSYNPPLTQQAQEYISKKTAPLVQPIKSTSLFEQIKKISTLNVTKQKMAMFYLQILQQNRILSIIQTPWNILPNMAILNISAIQSETNKEITEFDITFKKINYTETSISKTLSGKASSYAAPITNNNISGGNPQ